jgi:hypothetical protein
LRAWVDVDFLGTYSFPIYTLVNKGPVEGWYTLQAREGKKDVIKGDIHVRITLEDRESDDSSSLTPGQGLQVAKMRELRFADVVSSELLSSLSPMERKRQEIIFEFIHTEEQYVADVNIIIDVCAYARIGAYYDVEPFTY